MAKVCVYMDESAGALWRMVCNKCAHYDGAVSMGPFRASHWAAVRDQVRHNLPGGCPASRVESAAQRKEYAAWAKRLTEMEREQLVDRTD